LAAAGDGGAAADTSPQPILDDAARATYVARLRRLTQHLTRAESSGDRRRADGLRSEIAALQEELRAATGLGGRARTFAAANERARTAVRKALVRAIDRIDAADPALGQSLRASITTGTECAYVPDPRSPIMWSR
jgi:hypothetical protein